MYIIVVTVFEFLLLVSVIGLMVYLYALRINISYERGAEILKMLPEAELKNHHEVRLLVKSYKLV